MSNASDPLDTPILDEHLNNLGGNSSRVSWSPRASHDALDFKGLFEYDRFAFDRDTLERNNRVVLKPFYRAFQQFGEKPVTTQPLAGKSCPHCDAPTVLQESYETNQEILEDGFHNDESDELLASLGVCPNCRFWRWHYLTSFFHNRGGVYSIRYRSAMPKIEAFNPVLPDGCSQEIAQQMRRNPAVYHSINSQCFEKLVADVFRANHKNAEVIHVGRPHDGGKDIVFVDDGNEQWLISVKRRQSPDKSEGIDTIRNLIGVLVLNGVKNGMVVSSADHFTYQAKKAVGVVENEGFKLRLIDRGLLDRMLGRLLPHWPWENYLKEFSPAAWKLFSSESSVVREPLA